MVKKHLFAIPYFLLIFTSCLNLSGPGYFERKSEIVNSSNTHKLVKYQREFGATVGSSIGLLITSPNDTLLKDEEAFFVSYLESIDVKWLSDYQLLVRYPKDLQVFKQDSIKKGIRIKYEFLVIPDTFDSLKKPEINYTFVNAVELSVGYWQWANEIWDFQKNKSVLITDSTKLLSICNVIKSSKIMRSRYDVFTSWLVVTIQTTNKEEQLILQSDASQHSFWFDYQGNRYRDEDGKLAMLLSKYLKEGMSKRY